MNRASYLNSNQFDELMVLSAFASGCASIAKNTKDAQWCKWLKTADTFATKVIDERVQCLDANSREGVQKRVLKSDVIVVQSSLVCVKENQKQTITLDWDDFMDILAMAQWTCCRCEQGAKVAECPYKKMLLRLGVPVARENPADGECPYRWENEIRWINPDGKEIKP